ncbi:PorP/SprF family type IX secretion system membrane protein [Flavobacterium sp.]
MNFRKIYLLALLIVAQFANSQEGLPVYSDYLSDNYYLLHPSMAGAANCAKLRLTARQQWLGQKDAPALQTLSFNGALGERSGGGLIVFNDKNGYHSQTGMKLTYAHHIMFSRDNVDLNQLSFGMSAGFLQSNLDETTFYDNNPGFDPVIFGSIQKATYFNVDIGASYNFLDFYVHATVKNALASDRKLYTDSEPVNLRRFILNAGYTFGDSERIQWEPSFMFQLVTLTQEKTVDLNIKAYKDLDWGKLWGGLSYRRSLDGAQFVQGNGVADQKLQYVTPIIGVNFKKYVFSYTYSHLVGDAKFDAGGFHQITLGLNLFCKPEKYHCNCPAIN